MTSIETMPGVSPKARAAYKLKVVSFNVQQLLAAQAKEGKIKLRWQAISG